MTRLAQQEFEQRREMVLAMLTHQEMSRKQIQEATGFGRSVIWNVIDRLRDQRKIYVCGHGKNRYAAFELYRAGDEDDVLPPEEDQEEERKRRIVVVNVRKDPYLWASAGRSWS